MTRARPPRPRSLAAPTVVAAAAKPADPVPTPRAKPQIAATIQLASADAQLVAPPKPKPAPVADKPAQSAGKPETPADIINARGFWDAPATPQQATPAQVAALKARQALAAATEPQANRERLQRGLSGAGLRAGVRLPGRPRQRRRRLRAGPAHRPPRCRDARPRARDRDQHGGRQEHRRQDRNRDPPLRRQGREHLAQDRDAVAERQPRDVGDVDGRARYALPCAAISSSRRP